MKKLILSVALIFGTLSPVYADPFEPFGASPVFSAAAPVSIPFIVGMTGFVVLPILIMEGVDPWTPNFDVVSYEYPDQHHYQGQ